MISIEFVVNGTPRSVQSKPIAKAAWNAHVTASATAALPSPQIVVTSFVRVTVGFFFHVSDLDLDNILKPILDALNTVVYFDDEQVIDIIAFKRDFSSTYIATGISPVLAAQLTAAGVASEFVFVRIEDADGGMLP